MLDAIVEDPLTPVKRRSWSASYLRGNKDVRLDGEMIEIEDAGIASAAVCERLITAPR